MKYRVFVYYAKAEDRETVVTRTEMPFDASAHNYPEERVIAFAIHLLFTSCVVRYGDKRIARIALYAEDYPELPADPYPIVGVKVISENPREMIFRHFTN